MAKKTELNKIKPYRTKDGSLVRELMHPSVHGNKNQSLAEAEVPAGGRTFMHVHHRSEEIYHITEGVGKMTLGDESFDINKGDTVLIPPGTPHRVENTGGKDPLIILCASSPPYSHDDTELVEGN